MDTLDDELRRLLASDLSGDADAALAGVHELNRRRTTWRAAARGALAVACVVAIIVAIGGRGDQVPAPPVPQPAGVDLTGAVPWSDRTDVERWSPPSRVDPLGDEQCTADQLELTSASGEGAGGHMGTWFGFENVSDTSCLLYGYPELVGTEGTVDAEPDTFFPQPATIADLHPGETGLVVVETSFGCDPQTATIVVRNLQLRLPDGSLLDTGQKLESSCQLRVGKWYYDDGSSGEPAVRFRTLAAEIEAPASVKSGARLVYVVTLRNTGDAPVELEPCPPYAQSIQEPGQKPASYGTWRLSCDSVPTLAPGQEVRFAMQLGVPDRVSGALQLYWYLRDSAADPSLTTVEVVR